MNPSPPAPPRSAGRLRLWWTLLALAAAGIAVAVFLLPLYAGETCTAWADSPDMVCTTTRSSIRDHEGDGPLLRMLIPAALCLVPAAIRRRAVAWVVAGLLLVFCFITGFTVGVFFMPVAAGALTLAAIASAR